MWDALKTLCAVIGAYTIVGTVLTILQFFIGDRSGNSGRHKHWEDGD